ncbi:type II secretion system secretin GspD [Asticcacaulis tiandongensis]|uniref:type II secretion system secretin GspD n=1 Tax=Asticcacaulis tiandongensis TaxID=2565365 RepID=UPI001FE405D1|nr:type II secretion system secretin GspD [Asticcacaulis tiandongensis]
MGLICVLVFGTPIGSLAQSAGAQTYVYNFRDAEISQVADEVLGQGLRVAYRVDPGVTGRMNFHIEQRLSAAQLLAAFEGALNAYEVVLVREGDFVVLKSRKSAQIGASINTDGGATARIGYQVRAVPIQYALPSEIAKVLTSLSRDKLVLFSSDDLGLLLLGGTHDEIETALSSVRLFDQSPLTDARIRYYPLYNASAATVSADLGQVLKQAGAHGVTVMPLRRLNGLFVFSKSAEALDQVQNWVTRLDVPSNDESLKVTVYRPRGASAEALAKTLNEALGFSTTGMSGGSVSTSTSVGTSTTRETVSASAPSAASSSLSQGYSDEAMPRIVADKDTNSLIISVPESLRPRVMAVLAEIDREPVQVFIEASILEVTLNNEFSFGVDWQTINGSLSISNYTTEATNFAPVAPGFSVNYLRSDIKAAINALSSKSDVRIVSAPKITVRENGTALLQVGDQVPIIVQNAQSTSNGDAPLISTIDYRDTGVMLKVTPRILSDNRVSMDVTQEVSSVARTQTSGIDSPTIRQRRMESSLIIPEGTVVALGGLISSSQSEGEGGAPLLKDIPVFGNLFKQRTQTADRTELVVLIQVKVIRDNASYDQVWPSLGADIRELIGQGFVPF